MSCKHQDGEKLDAQGYSLAERLMLYQQAWQALKAHPELHPRTREWLDDKHNPFEIAETIDCLNNLIILPEPQNAAGLASAETLTKP